MSNIGGKKKREKNERFWKTLSSAMKWIFIMLLLLLIITILRELINLMEWNDILIRRVQTAESQMTELRTTIEVLELENQSLKIENAQAALQKIHIYNPQVSTNPPMVWGPFPEPITKPVPEAPSLLNPLDIPEPIILIPIVVAGWQLVKTLVFKMPLPI